MLKNSSSTETVQGNELVFVVGPPRSGTTVLYEILSCHFPVKSQISENHDLWEGPFHPRNWGYSSNHVSADIVLESTIGRDIAQKLVRRSFHRSKSKLFGAYCRLKSRRIWRKFFLILMLIESRFTPKRQQLQQQYIIEKTPRNAVRLEQLEKLFPKSKFILITDERTANIARVARAWKSETSWLEKLLFGERFGRSGYSLKLNNETVRWKFVLPRGWEKKAGRSEAIAEAQVDQCLIEINRFATQYPETVLCLRLEDLKHNLQGSFERIEAFLKISALNQLDKLPQVNRLK